jgi:hypothetical protein
VKAECKFIHKISPGFFLIIKNSKYNDLYFKLKYYCQQQLAIGPQLSTTTSSTGNIGSVEILRLREYWSEISTEATRNFQDLWYIDWVFGYATETLITFTFPWQWHGPILQGNPSEKPPSLVYSESDCLDSNLEPLAFVAGVLSTWL